MAGKTTFPPEMQWLCPYRQARHEDAPPIAGPDTSLYRFACGWPIVSRANGCLACLATPSWSTNLAPDAGLGATMGSVAEA